jgi:rod shape-determining protein MreD
MVLYLAGGLAVLAALLQSSGPGMSPISGSKPDLVLVLVLTGGIILGLRPAVFLAILGGLVLDVFSGLPFGFITLALLLVVPLVRLHNPDYLEPNLPLSMLIVLMASLVYYGVLALGILALGGRIDWQGLGTNIVLPASAMNTLISPIAYWLLRWLRGKSVPVRGYRD